jgi:hypothetical protein
MDGHVQAKRVKNSGYAGKIAPNLAKGEPAWFNCDYVASTGATLDYDIKAVPSGGTAENAICPSCGWNPQRGGDNLP